jgi:hypothetical protein
MSLQHISPRVRKVVALVGVASLGSTAAYGIGTQAGGGQAGAAAKSSSSAATRPGRGPSSADLATLADKLGVTTAQLRAALDANRPAKPKDGSRGDRFATDLAGALGISVAKAKAALDATRPANPPARGAKPDRSAMAGALAKELGLPTSTVTAALDKLAAAHKTDDAARRKAMAAGLAKSLNLDTAKVEAALAAWHPAGGPGHDGRGGPGGPPSAGQ